MKNVKEHGKPPQKPPKGPSPFNLFPGGGNGRPSQVAAKRPGPSQAPSLTHGGWIMPPGHSLWGHPNVPQPTKIKILRPVGTGQGTVTLPYKQPVVVPPWPRAPGLQPQNTGTATALELVSELQNMILPMCNTMNRMLERNMELERRSRNQLIRNPIIYHSLLVPSSGYRNLR